MAELQYLCTTVCFAIVLQPRSMEVGGLPLNPLPMPAASSEFDGLLHIDEDAWDASSAFAPFDPCYTVRDTLYQYAEAGDVQVTR